MKILYRVIEHDPIRWFETWFQEYHSTPDETAEACAIEFHQRETRHGNAPKWPMHVEIQQGREVFTMKLDIVGMIPVFGKV